MGQSYRAGSSIVRPILVALTENACEEPQMDVDEQTTRYKKASYAQSKSFSVYSIFNTEGELVEITNLETTHTFADFQLKTRKSSALDLYSHSDQLPELLEVFGTYPEWNATRPYLTGQQIWTSKKQTIPRNVIPDRELMNDLLFVFMGFDGQYIGPKFIMRPDGFRDVKFEIRVKIEASSHALLTRMLPLCDYVLTVQRFIEMRSGIEYGTVCHAVVAAMQCIVDDWLLLVTQLEGQLIEGQLNFQNLWFYVQPAMSVLAVLSEICKQTSVHDLRGTELLNLLHSKMLQFSGSQNSQALLKKLLEAGCVPYFQVLEKWLCDGILHDPYAEFMIEEDPEIQTTMTTSDLQSAYWMNRYKLRKTYLRLEKEMVSIRSVPNFLHNQADLILTTGKYLNAIKECGRQVKRPFADDEHLVFDKTGSYQGFIQKAHKSASHAFLMLFMKELNLVDWLRGLKHFFLMDPGDMIGHLMDIAQEELQKVASQVVVNRMQSLLELASKTSSIPSDTNIEGLKVELDHRSMVDLSVCLKQPHKNRSHQSSVRSSLQRSSFLPQRVSELAANNRASNLAEELTGWDIFMISYKVEWPMMLIVTPKLMQIYQLLFKQLFTLKRAECELTKTWKVLQKTRKMINTKKKDLLKICQTICFQMQHTVQQYLRYLTVHTVEPRWLAMEANLAKAHDIDKVIEIHKNFVDKVLWQSLLQKVKGVKGLDQVINISLMFTQFIGQKLDLDVTAEDINVLLSGGLAAKPAPSDLAQEKSRMLSAKLENALNTAEFEERVLKMKNEYKTKLSSLVMTLLDYCDTERGEASNAATSTTAMGAEELQSGEDLDKLMSLAETIKPC